MNVKEEEQELEAIQAAIYTEYENIKTATQRLFIALTQKEIPTRPESNVFGDNTLDNYLDSTREARRNFLYELEGVDGFLIDDLYNTIAYTYQVMTETLEMLEKVSASRKFDDI